MSIPTAFMMIGLPACGKSTYSENHLRHSLWRGAFRYSTDDEIESIAKMLGSTYDEVFASVFKEAEITVNERLMVALNDRRDIIWDQTNLRIKKRTSVLRRLDEHGYYRVGIVILPPTNMLDIAEYHRRLNSRPGKTIPEYVIRSMVETFEMPTMDEGFDELVFYNSFSRDGETFFTEVHYPDAIDEQFSFFKNHISSEVPA